MSSKEVKRANDCEKFRKHQCGVRVLISKYNNTRQLDRYMYTECHLPRTIESVAEKLGNGVPNQSRKSDGRSC